MMSRGLSKEQLEQNAFRARFGVSSEFESQYVQRRNETVR